MTVWNLLYFANVTINLTKLVTEGFKIAPNRTRVVSHSELSALLQNLRDGAPAFQIGSGADSISFITSQVPVTDANADGGKPPQKIITVRIPRREGEMGPAAVSQFPADELVSYIEGLIPPEKQDSEA